MIISKKYPHDDRYIVYSDGRVYSTISNIFLQPAISSGYLIYGSRLGTMHRILYETFVGIIPKDMVINHIDGNKINNNLENLEVVTYSENAKHAYRLGLIKPPKGEINGMAKLTEEQVKSMYVLFAEGYNNTQLAELFGVESKYISLIRTGRRWRYLYKQVTFWYPSRSYTFKVPHEDVLLAHKMLKDGVSTNKEISELTGIDSTSLSKMRHGNLYGDFIRDFTKIELQRLSKGIQFRNQIEINQVE